MAKSGSNELHYSRLWFSKKKNLAKALQGAIQVEFSTIPAYYTALLSMMDTSCDAYRLTRSVLMEEMFHVYQACGLLIGIGGKPKLTGDAVPTYPGFLPDFAQNSMPYLSLRRASPEVYSDVFMVIEKPGTAGAPVEGQVFETIGQFYGAVAQGMTDFVENKYDAKTNTWKKKSKSEQVKAEKELFCQSTDMQQWQDFYFGKFGGKYVKVSDLESAASAVNEIVQQGEGALHPSETQHIVPLEKYGVYNHYGHRIDGTFGPILGTTLELSHYFSFQKIAYGEAPLPDTYPITSAPDVSSYKDKNAKKLAKAFNVFFSTLMRSLQQSFHSGEENRELFFKVSMTIMHSVIPVLGANIMQLPVNEDADPSVGPNAAPTFEYVDDDLNSGIKHLRSVISKLPPTRSGAPLKVTLERILASVEGIKDICNKHGI